MNSNKIEPFIKFLIAVITIGIFLAWFIPICIRDGQELEAERNAACVEQYGDGSYFKSINYGRGGDVVYYCVVKDGNLKIFKEK